MPWFRRTLEDGLIKSRTVTREQIEDAKAVAAAEGKPWTQVLLDEETIHDGILLEAEAYVLRVPSVELRGHQVTNETLRLLPWELQERLRCVPVLQHEKRLWVATSVPRDRKLLAEIRQVARCRVYPALARATEIDELLQAARVEREYGDTEDLPVCCPVQYSGGAFGAGPVERVTDMVIRATARMGTPRVFLEHDPGHEVVGIRFSDTNGEGNQLVAALGIAVMNCIKVAANLEPYQAGVREGRLRFRTEGRSFVVHVSVDERSGGHEPAVRMRVEEVGAGTNEG